MYARERAKRWISPIPSPSISRKATSDNALQQVEGFGLLLQVPQTPGPTP
jgi:hypothetical protein